MKPLRSVLALLGASVFVMGGWCASVAYGEEAGHASSSTSAENSNSTRSLAQGQGIYMSYPEAGLPEKDERPEGMVPFYISHLGRHGAANPESQENIFKLLNFLSYESQQNNLTEKGEVLLGECKKLEQEYLNSWGKLSSRGVAEQEGITRRLMSKFPELFIPTSRITAISSFVPNCGENMRVADKVMREKQGVNPVLAQGWQFNRLLRFYDECPAYTKYKKQGEWKEIYQNYQSESLKPQHLIAGLFKKAPGKSAEQMLPFMTALYQTAAVLPSSASYVTLDKYFLPEEWQTLWATQNLYEYLKKSASPQGEGLPESVAWPLLFEFLVSADRVVTNSTQPAMSLRFSDAEALIPFAALMGIDGAAASVTQYNEVQKLWKDYEISPCSGNIQWVFYRDPQKKVWVKFLLNEKPVKIALATDRYPLYSWESVRAHFNEIVDNARRRAVVEGAPVFE